MVTPPFRAIALLGLLAALAGCATKADINAANQTIIAIQNKQVELQRQLMGQIQARSQQLEAGQQDLSAAQSEFRAEAEGVRQEVARIGKSIGDLRQQLADARADIAGLNARVKELQNNQAIGLGSLSKRIDDNHDAATARIDGQKKAMDAFATQVSAKVDAQTETLSALSKAQKADAEQDKKRDKSITDLGKTLDTLGKKITGELAAQGKRIDQMPAQGAGADPDALAALEKKVDFLGGKLPDQVDRNSKEAARVGQELRDLQTLLADLNARLKTLEGR